MPNAAEIFIDLVDKIAPDFVLECVKATGKPEELRNIYPRLLERWRRDFDALAKLGTRKVVDFLIEALKDEDSGVRSNAAYALGAIGDPKAIPYLLPLLKDEDLFVRWKAASGLSDISSKFFDEVEEALLVALKKDPAIKKWVFEALKEMGIRNPEAWVYYRNQVNSLSFSYFSRLPKNLLELYSTRTCRCQPEALIEALAILDDDGNPLHPYPGLRPG